MPRKTSTTTSFSEDFSKTVADGFDEIKKLIADTTIKTAEKRLLLNKQVNKLLEWGCAQDIRIYAMILANLIPPLSAVRYCFDDAITRRICEDFSKNKEIFFALLREKRQIHLAFCLNDLFCQIDYPGKCYESSLAWSLARIHNSELKPSFDLKPTIRRLMQQYLAQDIATPSIHPILLSSEIINFARTAKSFHDLLISPTSDLTQSEKKIRMAAIIKEIETVGTTTKDAELASFSGEIAAMIKWTLTEYMPTISAGSTAQRLHFLLAFSFEKFANLGSLTAYTQSILLGILLTLMQTSHKEYFSSSIDDLVVEFELFEEVYQKLLKKLRDHALYVAILINEREAIYASAPSTSVYLASTDSCTNPAKFSCGLFGENPAAKVEKPADDYRAEPEAAIRLYAAEKSQHMP